MKKIVEKNFLKLCLSIIVFTFFSIFIKNNDNVFAYDSDSDDFGVPLYEILEKESKGNDSFIDFSQGPSSSNGNGVYRYSKIPEGKYNIYYYRGDVKNNVVYRNYCWKIIRTTETAGTKLLYNGEVEYHPDGSVTCDNTGDKSAIISDSDGLTVYKPFDWNDLRLNSLHILGYMHGDTIDGTRIGDRIYYMGLLSELEDLDDSSFGTSYVKTSDGRYKIVNDEISTDEPSERYLGRYICDDYSTECSASDIRYIYSSYRNYYYAYSAELYSSSYEYSNGTYKLVNGKHYWESNGNDKYTCNNLEGECSELTAYYSGYSIKGNGSDIITLKNGIAEEKLIKENYSNALKNKNNSVVKDYIEKEWYPKTKLSFGSRDLEDTTFCSDSKFTTDVEYPINSNLYTSTYDRWSARKPTLDCSEEDSINVMSGKSSAPVGLITMDEVILAGGTANNNTSSYLYSGVPYWTMSSSHYTSNNAQAYVFAVGANGELSYKEVNYFYTLRPVISISHYALSVCNGDGSELNPYRSCGGPTYSVYYEITGDKPSSYVPPKDERYFPGYAPVRVDSLKKGDIVDGYRFKGWNTTDVNPLIEYGNDTFFTMPDHDVNFVGEFEKVYKVEYQFIGDVIPPKADDLLPKLEYYMPNEVVELADYPSAEGYEFLGWYDEDGSLMSDTIEIIDKDVYVYGKWKISDKEDGTGASDKENDTDVPNTFDGIVKYAVILFATSLILSITLVLRASLKKNKNII